MIVKPKGVTVNIDEMYFRAPQDVLPCLTSPTSVISKDKLKNVREVIGNCSRTISMFFANKLMSFNELTFQCLTHPFIACFVPSEWVVLYPANKSSSTQLLGMSLPIRWVRSYPFAG